MTRRFWSAATWLLAIALPGLASAQVVPSTTMTSTPPNDTPSISVGTLGYADFTFQQSPKITDAAGNTVSSSTFNVARMYINIIGNISHVVQFRITPDVTRETTVAAATIKGSLVLRLKYGFLQLNLNDWTGKFNGSWVRLGVQQTPVIDYVESVYRYRFQGTTFIERTGLLVSADAGMSFHANLPNNFGDFHIGFYNGEGYGAAEVNNQKALQARFTVRPMAKAPSVLARGLRVTGFYDRDFVMNGQERKRVVADAMYEHRWFNAGADFEQGQDQKFANTVISPEIKSRGWDVWVTPFFKEKGNGPEMLIRLDKFSPDVANESVAATAPYKRLIVGFAYWFPHPGGNQTACLLFDVDQQTFAGFANSGATATSRKFILHALFSY